MFGRQPPADLPAWPAPFIGARYTDDGKAKGTFNCWTLFAYVQREVFARDLPDYDGPVWSGRSGVGAMRVAAESFAQRFVEITAGDEREGDAILLRLNGAPIHIGCVVKRGWMLHINKETDGTIEDYDGSLWRDRIVGFYRPC